MQSRLAFCAYIESLRLQVQVSKETATGAKRGIAAYEGRAPVALCAAVYLSGNQTDTALCQRLALHSIALRTCVDEILHILRCYAAAIRPCELTRTAPASRIALLQAKSIKQYAIYTALDEFIAL